MYERSGGAMMRKMDYSLARMSGMLDLSSDEKVTCPPELQRRRKHVLPRWLREAVRWW